MAETPFKSRSKGPIDPRKANGDESTEETLLVHSWDGTEEITTTLCLNKWVISHNNGTCNCTSHCEEESLLGDWSTTVKNNHPRIVGNKETDPTVNGETT